MGVQRLVNCALASVRQTGSCRVLSTEKYQLNFLTLFSSKVRISAFSTGTIEPIKIASYTPSTISAQFIVYLLLCVKIGILFHYWHIKIIIKPVKKAMGIPIAQPYNPSIKLFFLSNLYSLSMSSVPGKRHFLQ